MLAPCFVRYLTLQRPVRPVDVDTRAGAARGRAVRGRPRAGVMVAPLAA